MLLMHILEVLVILALADTSHGRESSVNEDITSLILSYETKYCEPRCTATHGTDTLFPFPANVCTSCFCDPECRDFGDCCPDLYIGKGKYDLECIKISHPIHIYPKHIYVVTRCSLGDKQFSEELSRKCNTDNRLLVSIPRENATSFTFKNRFCAQCHGYEDHQTWGIDVACEEFPEQISAISDPVAILTSLEVSYMCVTEYRVPRKVLTRKCHETSPISECNVTGTWNMYDAAVEAACHAYSHVTKSGYRNIFCQLCNEGEISETPSFRLPEIGLQPVKPLTGLLQFEDGSTDADPNLDYCTCPRGEYHDITGQCRIILCPPYKQLKSGECLNIFTKYPDKRLRYFIDIYLDPMIENTLRIANLTQLKRVLTDYYISKLDAKTTLRKMVVKLYVTKSSNFEKDCCDDIAGVSTVDVSGMEIGLYIATTLSTEHAFATFADCISSLLFGEVRLHFDGLNVSFRAVYKHMLPVVHYVGHHTILYIYEPVTIEEDAFVVFPSSDVKPDCPQIMYRQYEYTQMANASVLLKNSNALIARDDFTPTKSSDILVCLPVLEDLKLLLNDVGTYKKRRFTSDCGTEQIRGVLTAVLAVCLCVNNIYLHL